MTLILTANALVAEQLKVAAVQQLKDLEVLTRILPANFLPALIQDALQVVRDAGDDRLLCGAVIEVDRFLTLAAHEVAAQPLSASDLPGGTPKPSAYRIFRRLLCYRKAAQQIMAPVVYLRLDLGGGGTSMSAPWTLKSKVLVELQLAQHRITKAGCCISELLTEYAAEGNRTSESEYSRLWMINTVLTVQLGRCATATNLLLSFDLPPRIVDQLRTEWGRLAELLAGDMTLKGAEAIDKQMDVIQALTCLDLGGGAHK